MPVSISVGNVLAMQLTIPDTAIMGKIKTYGELYPKYEKLANSTDVEGYQRPS